MVTFLVNSSATIGSGHFTRCATLSKLFRELGSDITWVCEDLNGAHWYLVPDFVKLIKIKDQSYTAVLLNHIKSVSNHKLIVIDDYRIDFSIEAPLRNFSKIMVIDDLANRNHSCDYLLDYNYRPEQSNPYSSLIPSDCKLALGSHFVILRDEFIKEHSQTILTRKTLKKVLVFFGGSDEKGHTLDFLNSLSKINTDLHFEILVSKANVHIEKIKKSNLPSNVYLNIQPQNLAQIVRESDIYYGSGGTFTWERMYLGLSGCVITIADNQVDSARQLNKDGYHKYLGHYHNVSHENGLKELIQFSKEIDSINKMRQKCFSSIEPLTIEKLKNFLG